jgi:hypothetical protein
MQNLSEMIKLQFEMALDTRTKEQLLTIIETFEKGFEPAIMTVGRGRCCLRSVKDTYLVGCERQVIDLVRVPLLRQWLIRYTKFEQDQDYSEGDLVKYAVNLIDTRVGNPGQAYPARLVQLIRHYNQDEVME